MEYDSTALKKLKLAELKDICTKFSLSSSGKKDDLVSRILEYQKSKDKPHEDEEDEFAHLAPPQDDIFDWDSLNVDMEKTDPSTFVANETKGESRKASTVNEKVKKDVIQATQKEPIPSSTSTEKKEKITETNKSKEQKNEAPVIENLQQKQTIISAPAVGVNLDFKNMNDEERKQLRLKRFNLLESPKTILSLDDEARKELRKQKFNSPNSVSNDIKKIQKRDDHKNEPSKTSTIEPSQAERDKLEQRRKKFGPVEPLPTTNNNNKRRFDKEKFLKRAKRFGVPIDKNKNQNKTKNP